MSEIVRSNYTISLETKNKTDYLRKEFKLNISELVDILLKFDESSISKMFEIFKIVNKDKIEDYSRVETPFGYFVWSEASTEMLRKIPLKDMKDKIDILALYAAEIGEKPKEQILIGMIQKQDAIATVASRTYDRLVKLEAEVENLKKREQILS